MFRRAAQILALVLVGVSPGISSAAPIVIDFAGAGIAYVILSGDALGGSFTLDDLTYAVPEPAVMSLVAIGLLGLARRKASRRCG